MIAINRSCATLEQLLEDNPDLRAVSGSGGCMSIWYGSCHYPGQEPDEVGYKYSGRNNWPLDEIEGLLGLACVAHRGSPRDGFTSLTRRSR